MPIHARPDKPRPPPPRDPPPGRLRAWTASHLRYFLDNHGCWTERQALQYLSALWLEVEAVHWTPEQRSVLEDVFQEKSWEFVRDFPLEVRERVEELVEVKSKVQKRTVFEVGADGRPLRDVNGRWKPKLVEPPKLMSPSDHANRFLKAVQRGIADVLKSATNTRNSHLDPAAFEDLPAETVPLDANIDAGRFADWFESWAKRNIPDDQYQAFCLVVLYGWSADEAARQLGVAEATVRSWVFRIRGRARNAWVSK